jgi:hypothetical protein
MTSGAVDTENPYLIEIDSPIWATITTADPSPSRVIAGRDSMGPITIPLGGLGWQMWHGFVDSIADRLTEPMQAEASIDDRNPLPDLLKSQSIAYIVSDRLRQHLSSIREIEFLPVSITLDTVGENRLQAIDSASYAWVNCWRSLDIVDWARSEMILRSPAPGSSLEHSPVKASEWNQLVLDPIPAGETLFCLQGLPRDRFFITDAFRRTLLEAGLNMRFRIAPLDRRLRADNTFIRETTARLNRLD